MTQLSPSHPGAAASAVAVAGPSIRCYNVKFSPNLGDGLLSECLEAALIDCGAASDTRSIDLAARTAYGDAMLGRDTIMKALDAMPGPLRRLAVRVPLALQAARKWRPHYAREMAGAEAVVIGGGNLISDLDLNFPTKLGLALAECARRKVPAVIYACGTATGWSATGLRLCRAHFSRPELKAVFVRDADSKRLFDEMFSAATGHVAQVVRDPGLMASELYPFDRPADRPRPVAGLGIMSHIAIRYHAESAPEAGYLDRWYLDVARGLIDAGYRVQVFTNGSPEDKAYAAQLEPGLRALGGDEVISFASQRTPQELCGHISQCDLLIAYRMHAIIAAYSYGVPAIGLAWDRKLAAFMQSVGRGDWLLDVASTSAADCVARAIETREAGIPEAERQQVIAEARVDVAKAYAVLREALG
ncbi:polysaccharide pyruvyl transferase family protein [Acidimangrovimonas pyrenivorans]|uniref:Polysaccharide pyruvyl transferase family protein n=1 Tax=Acidimangrovimonas pyrenivorans TaxID=2030798 RepID=A0ABV7AMM3_9RHOB